MVTVPAVSLPRVALGVPSDTDVPLTLPDARVASVEAATVIVSVLETADPTGEKAEVFAVIGVCEGELDTVTLSRCVGVPCVGVPGANSWKKHYTRLLADFERVFVFADGDQPGKEFATSLARELPVTIVAMPDGEDVNSVYVKYGGDYIRDKIGLNNER